MKPNDNRKRAADIWLDQKRTFSFIKGRVALYAILRAGGIGSGDEVLMPGFTCVVVPAAVHYTGATPRYYDIDPAFLNGDPKHACELITSKTKAVIVQHTFGYPAHLPPLAQYCADNGILLIEDCAHAVGAMVNDKAVGELGDAAFASFQWSKPITTGLGGMALVNNTNLLASMANVIEDEFREPSLVKSLSLLSMSMMHKLLFRPRLFWLLQDSYRWASRYGRVHGSSSSCELAEASMPADYKQLFGNIRQFYLRHAFGRIHGIINHRRMIASIYTQGLETLGIEPFKLAPGAYPVPLRYPVSVKDRDVIIQKARKAHLEIGDWFNAPLHPYTPQAPRYGFRDESCPHAVAAATGTINLPTHSTITRHEAKRVLDFLESHRHLLLG